MNQKKKKREEAAESSVGTRLTALIMNLVLLLAAACYVPTLPVATLLYILTAVLGSYLAYLYRDSRPGWLGTLPTVGTILLFTNFVFEVINGYMSSTATAVAAFVHLIAGLSSLHCFDLRTRTDFSIASLIGLALLTFLTGVGGKDPFFGLFILLYTVLAGLLLFFDSSSRSHELGPSRAVAATDKSKQPVVEKRLRALSLTSFLPILLLPIASFALFTIMPRSDSLLDVFIGSIRSRFPLSAYLSSQLGKGGRSQALRGGTESRDTGGSSFTVKGGEHGTAGGTTAQDKKPGKGSSSSTTVSATPLDKKSNDEVDLSKIKGPLTPAQAAKLKEQVKKDKVLSEAYEREGVDLNNPQSQAETLVMKVSGNHNVYLRKYAMNGFDGQIWKRALPTSSMLLKPNKTFGFDLTNSNSVYVPPALPTLEVKLDCRAEADLGYYVPTSWIPQIVRTAGDEVRLDTDGTVKATKPILRGSAFSVICQSPIYDLEVMRKQQLETLNEVEEERKDELETAKSCLTLSGGLSDKLKELSNKICQDPEANWFTRAEKIQNYLKTNYQYEADGLFKEQNGSEDPYQAIDNFLFQKKSGSCRHFATAHALLCRSQGIPSRLVIGYLPGTFNKNTGFSEIRGKDAHVWTEIYMPYWNWIPFDPTPSGRLPAHEEGGNVLSKFIRSGLANPFAQDIKSNRKPKRNLTDLNGLNKSNQEQADLEPPPPPGEKGKEGLKLPMLGTVDPQVMQTFARVLAILFAFALLIFCLVVYFKHKKDKAEKLFLAQYKPSTIVYLEVLDDLKRFDIVKFPTETVDEISTRLSDRLDTLRDEGRTVPEALSPVVSKFMELYNADRFGGDDYLDELTEIAQEIKRLATTVKN